MGSSPAATEAVRFGKYSLVARLATGGMAEIFLARLRGAAGFEKLVCIKRILPHLARDKQFVAMFLDEARIAARITHPNVCQVFELGEIDGAYYLAMEYLEGIPLSCFRRHDYYGEQPAPRLVAGIAIQACEGLHHAHQLKNSEGRPMELVHRDVSPQNLFVTADGIVKVLDFGIAKVQDATVRTSTGAVKGTYAYMAPEQLRGERVDRRIDVFALGIAMWETLTRRHLFKRDTEFLTFQAITGDPIEDVCELRPDVPPALSAVIMTALSRDRSDRFPTARMLGEAIASAIQPLTAPAISEEIARAFPAQLAEQAELIRVARSGGAFALDADRGPSVGLGTDLLTTPVSGQSGVSHASRHDTSSDARSQPGISRPDISRPGVSRPGVSRPDVSRHDTSNDALPALAVAPPRRVRTWRTLAFALAVVVGGAGVLLYARVAGEDNPRSARPVEATIASTPAPTGASPQGALSSSPASGSPPSGTPPSGSPPSGSPPSGSSPSGSPPSGSPPSGSPPSGSPPSGSPPSGSAPSGSAPNGSAPSGSAPSGSPPSGSPPSGSSPGAVPPSAAPPNGAPPDAARPADGSAASTAGKAPAGPTKPTAPRATARPSGPPGFITIDSAPVYAVIYIDGKSYGETPLVNLELAPGRHLVRAVAPSGATRDVRIAIESGKVAPATRIEW